MTKSRSPMMTQDSTAPREPAHPHVDHSHRRDHATGAALIDRALLAACTVSLLVYLLCSDAVRAFISEIARLSGKL